ncbi:MAG: 1,4-dihydroxy-2-naphthoate octaprenyltransferase [Simkaniaceae bacterium]|nr:1,4-dihydroxy-2-naphthoate octaprenyltransferase [Simkaniaceae bacterium]
MSVWVEAARPKTLPAILGPIAIGTSIAFKAGHFNLLTLLITLTAGVGVQVLSNFANDYFDWKKGADEGRTGPRRVMSANLVSANQMKLAMTLTSLIIFCSGLYLSFLGGPYIILLAAISICLGFLYTAGPYPIAYVGLSEIFVMIFFGLIATGVTTFLQEGNICYQAIAAGIGPGALSTAMLTLNNIRDIESDRASNKWTLPARFGKRFGMIELIGCFILAAFMPIYFVASGLAHPALLLTSIYTAINFPLIKRTTSAKSPKDYAEIFPRVGKLIFGYSTLFALGWLV